MKKPLRILYISHYFPPEVNAPAVRVSALSRHWAALGHQVTVVTGFPNHPTGVIPKEYRGKLFRKEMHEGVRVLRSFLYATANKGFARRILSYVSFMLSAIISAVFRSGKQDAVIATSPQFFVAIAGYIVSRVKRIPFIFEVRDIWPEEIVAVGAMKRGPAIRVLEKIELFLYRKAALIVAVASGTIEILSKRGVPKTKMILLPNGVDTGMFYPAADQRGIRDVFNVDGHFLVSYIGTHGLAHNLTTVLRAADRLRSHDDIRFMFVGDGADKERLVDLKSRLALDNVTFVPQQARSRIPSFYTTSDLCLVPLRQAELFTKNIPSKIYEIMASGKPLLIGARGESRQLVEAAEAGLAFEPDNDADLADKILSLSENRALARRLGENGRRFADRHFRQNEIAERYLETLTALCN